LAIRVIELGEVCVIENAHIADHTGAQKCGPMTGRIAGPAGK
jgi:hypothetical protein